MDTRKIMAWVLAALLPAGASGVYLFGTRALALMAICVASCMIAEHVWCRMMGTESTVSDLSAAVTGLLLAYNLPPSIPMWMPVVGGAFAIIVAKGFFGGIGQNIVNPALAGRAMMLICWPAAMTKWHAPSAGAMQWLQVDAATTATPLVSIKLADAVSSATTNSLPTLMEAFTGSVAGCIGETSAAALLVGFAVLLVKKIIFWRIPIVYMATVAALSALLGRGVSPLVEICVGGVMLGSIFMATDYATSPMTPKGQYIFAVGCGVLTMLIRAYGGYPEGVSYSILMMNLTVPLIDRATRPRILGEVRKNGR